MKKTYSTEFKLAVKHNLIPEHELSLIPKSTRHYICSFDFSHIHGLNYSESNIDLIREILSSQNLLSICRAYLYIFAAGKSLMKTVNLNFTSILKNTTARKRVIAIIHRTKSILGLDNILSFLNITRNTFYRWKNQKKCSDSPLQKCFRKYPNQLTVKEVDSMKRLFDDARTRYWPLTSVYYDAFRRKIISFKQRTFYKYAKILGISRPLPTSRRCKNKTGIRTDAPNKLWHADLTIFKTADNVKVCIYIIMDNFSRKILAYRASIDKKADIAFECLKDAYQKHILQKQPDFDVQLMVDGGSEVNNNLVDSYIETIPVKKIIAQQDVAFSNSMIEAVNKIMKYNYLFRDRIPDFESCCKYLEKFIPDYNERPHCSLQGLTPNEAYSGVTVDLSTASEQVRSARTLRILENQEYNCSTHSSKEVI